MPGEKDTVVVDAGCHVDVHGYEVVMPAASSWDECRVDVWREGLHAFYC